MPQTTTDNDNEQPSPIAQQLPSESGTVATTCLEKERQPSTFNLQPSTCNSLVAASVSSEQATAMVNARQLPTQPARRKIRRHGRVASLPKIQRDMVNRMLWNGVPYKNIVAALDDAGFTLIERNISNWATGGYLEWRLEQEAVLENRLNQDHLLSFLRRDDAPELPEVGLQAAATRLSQVLMQKLAHADDPEANLDSYSKMIDLLCRLNREIASTQKIRDDSRRTLGKDYDPVLVKDVEEVSAIEMERYYSNPGPGSELKTPEVPPLLPQIPTATFLAEQTREEEQAAELARVKRSTATLQKLLQKTPPASAPQPVNSAKSHKST